ncbi:acetylornithine transaminase [Kocuria sp. TGY1127_2]|uniref:acetylornithine transaminase n=1 Tax=Kocuria sp. TGY1127_2 TaxID=2711328 RepID=UPI0015BC3CC3|nr:acetylornithine transaminase [Kocuria sp. TGY1127_2]
MTQQDLLDDYRNDLLGVFGDPALVLTEGKGCLVTDADGRTYLDLLGGIAVNALGHGHPAWTEAISRQAGRLGHVSNFFTTPEQLRLARKLLDIAGAPDGGKVFFTNSGTEANEAALKLVRSHGNSTDPRKSRLLALKHGFHGRSTGALAVTSKEDYRAPFEPLPGGVEFIDPTVDALEHAMGEDVAGLILEPIQGEAGVHPLPEGFLEAARRLTKDNGALLVVDEVQTGMGRTGQWLASQGTLSGGLEPDVVTLAKSLGGGFPIGAMLAMTPDAVDVLGPGKHGTTFGGNPLAMAAGLATIQAIEDEDLLENARTMGRRLRDGLGAINGVVDVRGSGLLIGFDLEKPNSAEGALGPKAVSAARERGFIINATGPSTLRLAPPLIIEGTHVDAFLEALPTILEAAHGA